MKNKSSKLKTDHREEKYRRISTVIANMPLGDVIRPSSLARSIHLHPDTLKDTLDFYDTLKEIGFKTLRDKKGEIREIIRTDDGLDLRTDVRDIKKDMLIIKDMLDKLNTQIKKRKK